MTISSSVSLSLASQLLLRGVTKENLSATKGIPSLSTLLAIKNNQIDEKKFDAWASEHFDLFGMNVFPNASIFLDASGMLGGYVSDQVLSYYREAGFSPIATAEGPDHIGNEIAFLDFLEKSIQDPTSDNQATLMQSLKHRFIREHFAVWMPVIVQAVYLQDAPIYHTVLTAVFEKISLETVSNDREMEQPVDPASNESEGFLRDPDTRIKDIAQFLLTPWYTGVFLSKDRIAKIGRNQKLPRGFGDRLQILTNLLRAAAEYDQLKFVLQLIDQEVEIWENYYADLEIKQPHMQKVSNFWRKKTTRTRGMIVDMVKEIA